MTWVETRVGRGIFAVALLAALQTACGDDDKSTDKGDTGVPTGSLDGGNPFDAAVIRLPDGAIVGLTPDGSIVELPPSIDAATPDSGPVTSLPCGGNCSDGVDCTTDSCVNNACIHTIDTRACQAGFSCDLVKGCQQGVACGGAMDCADMNGCTTNETCDRTLARCSFDPLDNDGDGYPPASCGGADCNDDNGLISPGAAETCDGVDNNCNGTVDEGAAVGTGRVCTMGRAVCKEGLTSCGVLGCFDTNTDAQNCGQCGNNCGTAGTCTNGACSSTCAAPAMQCGQSCSDLQVSEVNCGMCGSPCGPRMGQTRACLAGACTACGNEAQACCSSGALALAACSGGLSCSATPGAAGAVCGCAAPNVKCGDSCANLATSEQHCGACGTACTQNQACLTDTHGTACVACGGLGEPCCALGGCGGGRICSPSSQTCVKGPGGNGPGGNGPG